MYISLLTVTSAELDSVAAKASSLKAGKMQVQPFAGSYNESLEWVEKLYSLGVDRNTIIGFLGDNLTRWQF